MDAIRVARAAPRPPSGAGAGARPPGEAAWNQLLDRYRDRLFGVCLRMVRNPETAADLTQDALVRIIHGFDSFDSRARLSTWMTRITINVCLSHLRKQKLRRHPSLDAPSRGRGAGGGDGGEPETLGNGLAQDREPDALRRVEQDEARSLVSRGLDRIDEDHRAVLILRDLRGLDYQEIADVLDVPVGTVKSRLFRARSALREAIERLDPTQTERD